ncbi:uncharacterized protein [Diadema antillarum]|uniref:uncharacterized protein n=1 Tax=Diadema antillarum TaxID=105358 RepID=UPI003A88A34B
MAFHHVAVLVVCLASLAASQTTTQQPANCPALVPPADGSLDVVETTATYSCDPGFTLSGSEVRTCESGTWTGTEGRCDPTPTSTPAAATQSMAPTQSPSMPMDGTNAPTMGGGGSTAMMGSEGPATTPMGDGDGHEGDNEGGDNDTHMGGDDDKDEDVVDEGLSRGQVALTILATLLILMTITAFGALLWWKYHGTSYVEVDVSHA